MRWLTQTLFSSIGKKVMMALTGLFLCTFLVEHLTGNLLLFVGPEAFNDYSEMMTSNPFIRTIEIFLFLSFFLHIIDGFRLTIENRKARPVGYAVKKTAGRSTLASRTMIVSGSILFIFLVIHLRTFFVRFRFGGLTGLESEYDVVVMAFRSPLYAGFYVVAMTLLGFHLNHGFQSGFQSLGINHPKYTPLIHWAGWAFSFVVPLGFASIPIYFCLKSLK